MRNHVVRYSDRQRVQLEELLNRLSDTEAFTFVRQVVGYYYYVEVWRYREIDVVFEEANLARLEETKRTPPGLIHELVFHPSGQLASTWQPWDGVLGPGARPRPHGPNHWLTTAANQLTGLPRVRDCTGP